MPISWPRCRILWDFHWSGISFSRMEFPISKSSVEALMHCNPRSFIASLNNNFMLNMGMRNPLLASEWNHIITGRRGTVSELSMTYWKYNWRIRHLCTEIQPSITSIISSSQVKFGPLICFRHSKLPSGEELYSSGTGLLNIPAFASLRLKALLRGINLSRLLADPLSSSNEAQ